MLTALRAARALLGIVGAYQMLGVVLSCLQALSYAGPIPAGYWAIVVIKLAIGLVFLQLFHWLRQVVNRRAGQTVLAQIWSL